MLRVVYHGILSLKIKASAEDQKKSVDVSADKNREIGTKCAKVIAAIGLCHQFVNDPVLLRATNQEAFTSHAPTEHIDDSKVH